MNWKSSSLSQTVLRGQSSDNQQGGKKGWKRKNITLYFSRQKALHLCSQLCSWLLVDFLKSKKLCSREIGPRDSLRVYFFLYFRIFGINLQLSQSCFGNSGLLQIYMYAISQLCREFSGALFSHLLPRHIIYMCVSTNNGKIE